MRFEAARLQETVKIHSGWIHGYSVAQTEAIRTECVDSLARTLNFSAIIRFSSPTNCAKVNSRNTAQNNLRSGVLRKNGLKQICGEVFFGRMASNRFAEGCFLKEWLQTDLRRGDLRKNGIQPICGEVFFGRMAFNRFAERCSSEEWLQTDLRRGVL
jgi:hypothetical protein